MKRQKEQKQKNQKEQKKSKKLKVKKRKKYKGATFLEDEEGQINLFKITNETIKNRRCYEIDSSF